MRTPIVPDYEPTRPSPQRPSPLDGAAEVLLWLLLGTVALGFGCVGLVELGWWLST